MQGNLHSRGTLASLAFITAHPGLQVQMFYVVGNCTISAVGGFVWRGILQLASGSASMPTCTVNSILNVRPSFSLTRGR